MEENLSLELLTFFAGKPEEEGLARQVITWLLAEVPGTGIRVQKSQITFRGRYNFGALSLPRRARDKKAHALLLTLGLPGRLEGERVFVATEPYPGRWTNHILLTGPRDLDEELRGWVHAAYQFAESKGRGTNP